MSENYLNQDAPKLNVAFFDIETDFDPERGFADPRVSITAINCTLTMVRRSHNISSCRQTLTMEQAKEECKEWGEEVVLFENEGDMLEAFLRFDTG